MSFQRLLLIVFSTIALAAASCDGTILQKVKVCYRTYMAGFNVTMDDRLIEYWSFHHLRASWLIYGDIKALFSVCQLGKTLLSCLEPFSCLGYSDYSQLGPSGANTSISYWKDLNVTQYQCGPGFNIMRNEMPCMEKARETYKKELEQCHKDYDVNYYKLGMCRAEQIFLDCQMTTLETACDWNAGVFMCNTVLASFNSIDPSCYINKEVSCPSPKKKTIEVYPF